MTFSKRNRYFEFGSSLLKLTIANTSALSFMKSDWNVKIQNQETSGHTEIHLGASRKRNSMENNVCLAGGLPQSWISEDAPGVTLLSHTPPDRAQRSLTLFTVTSSGYSIISEPALSTCV